MIIFMEFCDWGPIRNQLNLVHTLEFCVSKISYE